MRHIIINCVTVIVTLCYSYCHKVPHMVTECHSVPLGVTFLPGIALAVGSIPVRGPNETELSSVGRTGGWVAAQYSSSQPQRCSPASSNVFSLKRMSHISSGHCANFSAATICSQFHQHFTSSFDKCKCSGAQLQFHQQYRVQLVLPVHSTKSYAQLLRCRLYTMHQ